MNAIESIEFQKNTNAQTSCYNNVASIEDDLISQRLRAKQTHAFSSSTNHTFEIVLLPISNYSEEKTFFMFRSEKACSEDCNELKNNMDVSFATADDSSDEIVEIKAAKKLRISILSGLEFDGHNQGDMTPEFSPKRKQPNFEALGKLLSGFAKLNDTVEKVQNKDVTFKFAHLKIFAQIKALQSQKKSAPAQISPRSKITEKKKLFYSQWFKSQKSGQFPGCDMATNAAHTLAMRN